jgi:hypothetical protein
VKNFYTYLREILDISLGALLFISSPTFAQSFAQSHSNPSTPPTAFTSLLESESHNLSALAPGAPLQPIADLGCLLSAPERMHRYQALVAELNRARNRVAEAQRSRDIILDASRAMHDSFITSDIVLGIAVLADVSLMIPAVAGTVELGALRLTYATTLNTVGLWRNAYNIFNADRRIVGRLDRTLTRTFERLSQDPLEVRDGIFFLTDPDCSGTRCPIRSTQIKEIANDLNDWFEWTSQDYPATPVTRSAFLDLVYSIPERISQSYTRRLVHLEAPYSAAISTLVDTEYAYLNSLKRILINDYAACHSGRSLVSDLFSAQ